ncbi:uncharacterized protein [Eurosta solidaginis]|uniref:uncharacterized protein n=1 Tax=Eurosta solidaginis TaxID=178769 RepID=UPI003530F36B
MNQFSRITFKQVESGEYKTTAGKTDFINGRKSRDSKRNLHKSTIYKKVEEITAELNCLGPPVRETKKWMKVWADMKSKTKKKMSENMVEYRATGGGPKRLNAYTHAEEAIMGLLQLHTSVDPTGEEHGLNAN